MSNFFQPLPETVECSNSSQLMKVVDSLMPLEQLSAKEDAIKSMSDKVPVQVRKYTFLKQFCFTFESQNSRDFTVLTFNPKALHV